MPTFTKLQNELLTELIAGALSPLQERVLELEKDCNLTKLQHISVISDLNSEWCERLHDLEVTLTTKNRHLEENIRLLEKKCAKNISHHHCHTTVPSPYQKEPQSIFNDPKILLLQEKVNLLWRKIDDVDQYSKRYNLIIDGLPLRRNETPDSIRDSVIAELKRLKLNIDALEVDRAHRSSMPFMTITEFVSSPPLSAS
jgi:hypothetical protein